MKSIYAEINIFKQLNKLGININKYRIDAIYNTNNLGFESYILHVKVNGIGFLLLYFFFENNSKCKNRLKISILQKYFIIF